MTGGGVGERPTGLASGPCSGWALASTSGPASATGSRWESALASAPGRRKLAGERRVEPVPGQAGPAAVALTERPGCRDHVAGLDVGATEGRIGRDDPERPAAIVDRDPEPVRQLARRRRDRPGDRQAKAFERLARLAGRRGHGSRERAGPGDGDRAAIGRQDPQAEVAGQRPWDLDDRPGAGSASRAPRRAGSQSRLMRPGRTRRALTSSAPSPVVSTPRIVTPAPSARRRASAIAVIGIGVAAGVGVGVGCGVGTGRRDRAGRRRRRRASASASASAWASASASGTASEPASGVGVGSGEAVGVGVGSTVGVGVGVGTASVWASASVPASTTGVDVGTGVGTGVGAGVTTGVGEGPAGGVAGDARFCGARQRADDEVGAVRVRVGPVAEEAAWQALDARSRGRRSGSPAFDERARRVAPAHRVDGFAADRSQHDRAAGRREPAAVRRVGDGRVDPGGVRHEQVPAGLEDRRRRPRRLPGHGAAGRGRVDELVSGQVDGDGPGVRDLGELVRRRSAAGLDLGHDQRRRRPRDRGGRRDAPDCGDADGRTAASEPRTSRSRAAWPARRTRSIDNLPAGAGGLAADVAGGERVLPAAAHRRQLPVTGRHPRLHRALHRRLVAAPAPTSRRRS